MPDAHRHAAAGAFCHCRRSISAAGFEPMPRYVDIGITSRRLPILTLPISILAVTISMLTR